MPECLFCRQPAPDNEWHVSCIRKFFGTTRLPHLDLTLDALERYAAESVLARTTVPGVQKKLSLHLETSRNETRLTIVGLWGNFILKPPTVEYPELPENEDAVMHLATFFGIECVPHALIRLRSGELAYIARRIDRDKTGHKIAMEDFCQLDGRMTEDKYKGSYERCGRVIWHYSTRPGLDAWDLMNRLLFCFITGNADMHLKNFSLIETASGHVLSPAYDLVSTMLAIQDDPEETALALNGKKARLKLSDFEQLAMKLEVNELAWQRLVHRYQSVSKDTLARICQESFLSPTKKTELQKIIENRMGRLFL